MTETATYGTAGRIQHDATRFYSGKIYAGMPQEVDKISYIENSPDPDAIGTVHLASSEKMDALPDNSVHLMVTSPPYNVGKEYDTDLPLDDYLSFLRRVWAETYRVLVPGGRACVNVANLGRRPYIPLSSFITTDMMQLGFLPRGTVIWIKKGGGTRSTAWGSWQSASCPVLRDAHEYILMFSKKRFNRPKADHVDTISKADFLTFTKGEWTFSPVSAKRVGHPAPFPVELPARCIQLYTFKGDIVLDPFAGSGTSCVAALAADRRFVGYEITAKYRKHALKRIQTTKEALPCRPIN